MFRQLNEYMTNQPTVNSYNTTYSKNDIINPIAEPRSESRVPITVTNDDLLTVRTLKHIEEVNAHMAALKGQTLAKPAKELRIHPLAHDLHTTQGKHTETYNFCHDLTDRSMPPYPSACLQQLLIGLVDVKAEDLNRISPWSEVKNYIALITKMSSQNVQHTTKGMEIFTYQIMEGIPVITGYTVDTAVRSRTNQILTMACYTLEHDELINFSIPVEPENGIALSVNTFLPNWSSGDTVQTTNYEPMAALVPYAPQTLAIRYVPTKQHTFLSQTIRLKAGVPNLVKTQHIQTMKGPQAQITIYRRLTGPFLTFQPYTDPVYTGNKYTWTETRMPEVAAIRFSGASLQFHTTGHDILRTPGTHGYAELHGSAIHILSVHPSAWSIATFVFSIGSIPPTTPLTACSLFVESQFNCGVYGSTNHNIKFACGAATIPLSVRTWYMMVCSRHNNSIALYALDPLKNLIIPTGFVPVPTMKKGHPYIQIGDANTSMNLNVAWLHLFDNSINTIDPVAEL